MKITGDINKTARDSYLAKLVGGILPEQVMGGDFDGLLYYPTQLFEGSIYWLTRNGLVKPPNSGLTA